jgi:predicted transcriptional regulator
MKDFLQERHDLRLESLHVCDDANLVTPCRRGEIIIEGMTGNETQVWKQSE